MGALLAICSSTLFGIADFFGGMSARRIAPLLSALVSNAAGLVVLVGIALVAGGSPTSRDLALGAAAGAIGSVALATFYFALARGAMSVVAPISAVTAAVVPVASGVWLGESPTAVQWLGVVVAFPAIALIAREGTTDAPSPAPPLEERWAPASRRLGVTAGLLAGLGFGTFVVLITRTGPESGPWPLVGSRTVASVVLAALVALVRPAVRGASARGVRLGIAAGVLDGTSNIILLEAGRRGMLVVVGVIGALYPASTVVLARAVLHERLQRQQLAGLGLAVVAVVLIALR